MMSERTIRVFHVRISGIPSLINDDDRELFRWIFSEVTKIRFHLRDKSFSYVEGKYCADDELKVTCLEVKSIIEEQISDRFDVEPIVFVDENFHELRYEHSEFPGRSDYE